MGAVLEAKLFSEEDSDEAKLYGSFLVYSASSAKVTEGSVPGCSGPFLQVGVFEGHVYTPVVKSSLGGEGATTGEKSGVTVNRRRR